MRGKRTDFNNTLFNFKANDFCRIVGWSKYIYTHAVGIIKDAFSPMADCVTCCVFKSGIRFGGACSRGDGKLAHAVFGSDCKDPVNTTPGTTHGAALLIEGACFIYTVGIIIGGIIADDRTAIHIKCSICGYRYTAALTCGISGDTTAVHIQCSACGKKHTAAVGGIATGDNTRANTVAKGKSAA